MLEKHDKYKFIKETYTNFTLALIDTTKDWTELHGKMTFEVKYFLKVN